MKTSSEWSFKHWWANHKGTDLPVNSLLHDIFGDRDFPDTADKDVLLDYLHQRKADAGALDSFETIWRIYQSVR